MLFGRQKTGGADWLLVCLGNPGDKYQGTRHNVGFMLADELARRTGPPVTRLKFQALTAMMELGGQRVLVMKPVTYMNLSGQAAREAAQFYRVPPERVMVVCDDISLPVGKLRLRAGGSAGGHNGLRSLIAQLHSDRFPRLKIGVGAKPHPDYDLAAWVLGKFQGEDAKAIAAAVPRGADALETAFAKGIEAAMNQYN